MPTTNTHGSTREEYRRGEDPDEDKARDAKSSSWQVDYWNYRKHNPISLTSATSYADHCRDIRRPLFVRDTGNHIFQGVDLGDDQQDTVNYRGEKEFPTPVSVYYMLQWDGYRVRWEPPFRKKQKRE